MATAGLFSMLAGGGDEEAYQRQLDEQKAMKIAEMTGDQARGYLAATAGREAGKGIAGLFGVDVSDPIARQSAQLRRLATSIDTSTPEGMMKFAQAARTINPDIANQAVQQSLSMSQTLANIAKANKPNAGSVSERNRSLISQAEVKLANKQELTPPELASVRWLVSQETQAKIYPDKDTGELVRVEPLNLSEAAPNIAQLLGKAGTAPVGGGTAPISVVGQAVASTPAGTQIAPGVTTVPTPTSIARAEAKGEKVQSAIEGIDQSIKLIGGIESILSTGGLTTNPLLYGVASSIGGTDAKTIATKLKGVEAQKVISTIEEMKNQSKTGATGFGALNIAELDQLKSSFLALDPASKSFPQDLKDWKERLEVIKTKLQNKGEGKYSSNVESQISAVMNDPRNKGKTREQVINSLKSKGLIQ